MKKITAGLLPLYIKLYDDSNIDRLSLEIFYDKIAKLLEKQGLNIVRSDICRVSNEFNSAVKKFEDEKVDAIITLHLAYSPSLESIEALANTKLPLVILDTTEAYGFEKKYSNDFIANNHGIHGVMDMCNLLKRRGKKYVVCAGHVNDGLVIKKTVNCVKSAVAAQLLQGSKTGLFGTSFNGMGDFLVSDEEMQNEFGVKLVHISDCEMKNAYNAVSETEILTERKAYQDDYEISIDVDEDKLKNSIKSCLAVRNLVKEKGLNAFSVNFLDINNKNLQSMPFVECCKAMQNGIGYAGEGDALTASFVGAIAKTYDEFSFIEIFCPGWKENRIFISHMGEMNYTVCKDKPKMFSGDFPYTDAEFCVKALAEYKSGKAVFCNVFKGENEKYNLLLSDIEMVDGDTHDFDNSIRGWFVPPVPVPDFLEKLSEYGAIHHSFIVYDTDVKAMEYFGELLNLKVVKI